MRGIAEGVCELVRQFDVADVVFEVMYHDGVIFLQKYKKYLVVCAFTFFFLAAERKKITKKKDCRLPFRS
jgi:hypothetical protein